MLVDQWIQGKTGKTENSATISATLEVGFAAWGPGLLTSWKRSEAAKNGPSQ